MSLEEMKSVAVQADHLGFSLLTLTGGEPTLLSNSVLCEYFKFIKENTGIKFIRIVTNGHWAKSYEDAYEKLYGWQEAGLDELNVSCGLFHQECVPIENVHNAYQAACDLNYRTILLAAEFVKRTKHPDKDCLTIYDFEKIVNSRAKQRLVNPLVKSNRGLIVSSVAPVGRASEYINREDLVYYNLSELPDQCKEVGRILSLLPDGRATICCSVDLVNQSFLAIGNWREQTIEELVEAVDDDYIANIIRYYGLKSIKEFALHKNVKDLAYKPNYCSICELCTELFRNQDFMEAITKYKAEIEEEMIKYISFDRCKYGKKIYDRS